MEDSDGKRLYYSRQRGIWSMPVNKGPEEPLPELASLPRTRVWTVAADGIYFLEGEATPHAAVRFFDFGTRKVTTVLIPSRPAAHITPGLDVSPDGQRLLFTQVDQKIEGLFMLENFR